MKHRDYEELLILYSYEELDGREARVLERHLAGCLECRTELERVRSSGEMFRREAPSPSETALLQARSRLRESIRERHTRTFSDRFLDRLLPSRPALVAHAAVLLVGMLIGYLGLGAWSPTGEEDSFDWSGDQIQNVRFEQFDPEADRLELTFEVARRYRVAGSREDRQIQRLLAHALISNRNPGVRLRAVTTMERTPASGANQESVDALIGALRTDENVAVRQKALLALKDYPPTPEIKQAWIEALVGDDNPRVRMEAIQALTELAEEEADLATELLDRLGEGLRREENAFVRTRTQRFLHQVGYGKF